MRAVNPPSGTWPDAVDAALLVPLLAVVVAALVLGIAEWRASRPAWGAALLALAPLLLLGAALRLPSIGQKSAWHDEGLTAIRVAGYRSEEVIGVAAGGVWLADLARFARLKPDSLPAFLLHPGRHNPDVHPPLYFYLARLWAELAGSGFAALRRLSALLGVLAILAAAWLGLEVSGSRAVALLSGALIAVSPLQVLYSREARMYSLFSLLALASTAALVRFVRLGGRRRAALYAALVGLGVLSHGLFGLVAAGQPLAALVLCRGDARDRRKPALVATVAGAACALPWGLVALAARRQDGLRWLSDPIGTWQWSKRVIDGLAMNLGDFAPPRFGPGLLVVAALLALAAIGQRRAPLGTALALPALLYLGALLVVDVATHRMLLAQPRYVLVPAALLLVLAACAIDAVPGKLRPAFGAGAGLVLLAIAWTAHGLALRPQYWIIPSAMSWRLANSLANSPQPRLLLPSRTDGRGPSLVALAAAVRTPVWVQPWATIPDRGIGSLVLAGTVPEAPLEAELGVELERAGHMVYRVVAPVAHQEVR